MSLSRSMDVMYSPWYSCNCAWGGGGRDVVIVYKLGCGILFCEGTIRLGVGFTIQKMGH